MIWLWFIIAGLASHRLSLMFSKESGPARIFRKIRRLPSPKSSAHEGLQCLWCLSVYSSAVVTYLLHPILELEWRCLVVFWLAASSSAIVWNQAFTKG
jgi:hypothetical protein